MRPINCRSDAEGSRCELGFLTTVHRPAKREDEHESGQPKQVAQSAGEFRVQSRLPVARNQSPRVDPAPEETRSGLGGDG